MHWNQPVRRRITKLNTKFIDIGIPSSLNKAQTLYQKFSYKNKNMKYLITGKKGLLGSSFIRELEKEMKISWNWKRRL